jgi:hypothetical protein
MLTQLAELTTTTTTVIQANCPNCHTGKFGVDNYFKYGLPNSYYGATCNNCQFEIHKLTINTDKTVTLEFDAEQAEDTRQQDGLLLVKLNVESTPVIYFIMPHIIYRHNYTMAKDGRTIDQQMDYFINQHTCPSNLTCFTVIAGNDTDPHGLLEYIQLVVKPANWHKINNSYADICQIFDRLPVMEIDGQTVAPQLVIKDK